MLFICAFIRAVTRHYFISAYIYRMGTSLKTAPSRFEGLPDSVYNLYDTRNEANDVRFRGECLGLVVKVSHLAQYLRGFETCEMLHFNFVLTQE